LSDRKSIWLEKKTGCWFVGGDDLPRALENVLSCPAPAWKKTELKMGRERERERERERVCDRCASFSHNTTLPQNNGAISALGTRFIE